jgi:hypothetical protein
VLCFVNSPRVFREERLGLNWVDSRGVYDRINGNTV